MASATQSATQGRYRVYWALLVVVLAGAAASAASAQTSPESGGPPARSQPGLLDALNRWFNKATEDLSSGRDSAAAAVGNLPVPRIVTGRTICAPGVNGAPDCQAAAQAVCRQRGLSGGRSMDVETVEDCLSRALLARAGQAGTCKTNTYVTRVACP